jgi:hypothetical protein
MVEEAVAMVEEVAASLAAVGISLADISVGLRGIVLPTMASHYTKERTLRGTKIISDTIDISAPSLFCVGSFKVRRWLGQLR